MTADGSRRGTAATIRPARPDDAPALDDICLRTGADGQDASDRFSDPGLLGAVWVGPYLALEPDLAFVVAGGDGVVGGYVLGVRDTADWERRCEASWWPPLRDRYPLATWPGEGPEADLVRHLHRPPRADPDLLAAYPSHLHVDLLPAWQGAGWGRRLLETLFAALTAAGSPGVHLRVSRRNARAIAFYRRMGFAPVADDERALTMVRALDR